jgi:hypothetical protein
MSHWTFWEWVAYAILFIAACITAADTGFKQSPILMEQLPHFIHSPWWGFTPVVLVLLATGILVARELEWLTSKKNRISFAQVDLTTYVPEVIHNEEFRNQEVLLDGREYRNCKFYSVSLMYNGTTPIRLSNNYFYGGVMLKSANPQVESAWTLIIATGLIRDDVILTGREKDLIQRGQRTPPQV